MITLASTKLPTDTTARELLSALDEARQIGSLSARDPGFGLPEAYRVTAAARGLREARGERVIGRKIGFTNTTIWDEYDVHAPIWGYVYATTRQDLAGPGVSFDLTGLAEPRIEPEIMLHLVEAPRPDMDDLALMGCIGHVSHGFEIVQSLFADWRFSPADTVAAFGLHGALLTGEPSPVEPGTEAAWVEALASFEIALSRDGQAIDTGYAENVLCGGPLVALRHLVELLEADRDSPPLAAGEIVSTGTVTRAFPVEKGETWTTSLSGLALPGATVTFS
ncbi:2-keto-4-pentenoate hydratase [Enterovirga rhinocerotis]|uniref:2-oxo-3-hexenedioate decarboxylase n=1 Tax=Enterovirga rhinocerotis TaxID=1339210 RepID=A0A4R7C7C7_9HYPH|nr:hydratase [Enterovirga rhinocerotis]TDR94534.1 2-oxo-3-hexenedioate decarboxylase [Enterovirga rhinocerotis]